MKSKELSITDQFHKLDEHLCALKISFLLYKNLNLTSSELSDDEHATLKEHYSDILQSEVAIFSQTIFIQLHKFFDNNTKAIKIYSLIEECKIHNDSEASSLLSKYEFLQKKHSKDIRKIRHNVYAHINRHNETEYFFKGINISYGDVKEIINELEDIMRNISRLLEVIRKPFTDPENAQKEHIKILRLAIKDIDDT